MPPLVHREQALKYVGGKTFFQQDGIWMDTTYESELMKPVRIEDDSSASYELLAGWIWRR